MLLALGSAAIGLSTAGAGVAAAAPVPCSPAGALNGVPKFNCQFYPSGNGISGGSPVVRTDGTGVGFLRKGTNFVLCQRVGGMVRAGRYFNNNWAFTQADNLKFGWVNAVYASGGDNNEPFSGPPTCARGVSNSYGDPPGGSFVNPDADLDTSQVDDLRCQDSICVYDRAQVDLNNPGRHVRYSVGSKDMSRHGPFFDNMTSAIWNSTSYPWCVYEHANYGGRFTIVAPSSGPRYVGQAWNDIISSMRPARGPRRNHC